MLINKPLWKKWWNESENVKKNNGNQISEKKCKKRGEITSCHIIMKNPEKLYYLKVVSGN
jgi:hypothetical protein